ncbi:hypothetical protein DVR12_03935 [Chitinophaga silvatica]|uniref:histidine kinase n=1 Tax=Chitinophaga silvatica TaxID=2282649 RepID=A0A3E1YHM2_9BACT|nr:7TM diverse intracellular signaling domain-containing protein [Chitinophaga silvatica]RFS26945.1 hypothetical protein DVR12_03935 [Chitinophaga silvatica]
MNLTYIWLTLTLLFGILNPLQAQQVRLVDTSMLYYVSNPYILKDNNGDLSFEQAFKELEKFKQSENPIAAVGVNKAPVWIYFKMINKSPNRKWAMWIEPPAYQELEVCIKRTADSTDILPISANKSNGLTLQFELSQNDSATVFIRIRSTHTLKVPVRIGTLQKLYEHNIRYNLTRGVLQGLLIALMLYNLFIYFSIQDKAYLYFTLHTFFTLLFYLTWMGYYHNSFLDLLNEHMAILLSISIIFSILFTISFLKLNSTNKKLSRIGFSLIVMNIGIILISILGNPILAYIIFQTSMYLVFLFWLTSGIYSVKKGFKPGKYYLTAFGVLLLSGTLYNLFDNGWLFTGYESAIGLQIGTCLQSLILSFALADKLNSSKQETMLLQKQVLAQASRFSQRLISSSDTERGHIAGKLNRTVNDSLVNMKNEILLYQKRHPNSHTSELNQLSAYLSDTITDINDITLSLRPYQIEMFGLTKSIYFLIREADNTPDRKMDVKIENIDGCLSFEQEINVYRIVQELLNNMIKHSSAVYCKVHISIIEHSIEVVYKDNGIGFKLNQSESGFGLKNLQERVNLLRGSIQFFSIVNQGTTAIIKIPVQNIKLS